MSKVWSTTCHTCERGVSQSSKCVVLRVWGGLVCSRSVCVQCVWGENMRQFEKSVDAKRHHSVFVSAIALCARARASGLR